LHLLDFIKANNDWETKLQTKPYCIAVKRKDSLAIFTYSQIDSDFYNPLVRECRGIILDMDTLNPVCVPFYKFGNYREGYAPDIDWSTARVQEKVDGSLIKLWWHKGEWRVSTNGTIDAKDASIGCDVSPYASFYDLFIIASEGVLNYSQLDKDNTYLFELVSPFNRVVVPHSEPKVYHIGTRNNKTLVETEIDIGVEKPRSYSLKSLKECVAAAGSLPFNDEGYVVVDKNWNRIKIKSPAYVAAHHLKNNGVITKARIVAMLKLHEEDEFLNYYPEFNCAFDEVQGSIDAFILRMQEEINAAHGISDRKEFAMIAKNSACPPLMFSWFDGKVSTASEWLANQADDKVVRWIEMCG
jgi:hypothetical protein